MSLIEAAVRVSRVVNLFGWDKTFNNENGWKVSNPNGIGGFQLGHPPLSNGRPASVNAIQLYALGRCREAIDVATRVMRQPKEGDNHRLRACELILDRGVGRPSQAVSMDIALTRPLEEMSVEELRAFREKYAAMVTASPKLIEHVLESEQREQQLPPLADEATSPPGNDVSAEVATPAPPRLRGRPRRRPPSSNTPETV
jgi:hypothetical protein